MSADAATALEAQIDTLDPTQRMAYEAIARWASARAQWKSSLQGDSQPLAASPRLRLLLLGTAGTGKTHTAKAGITQARRMLGGFKKALTLAFSGVAAVNLGGGSCTIDSIFHTNDAAADEDLQGDSLDRLVAALQDVELLVIDEISTVGAAQFEIVNRRLEQVGKVLWRKRFGTQPPNSLGDFGGLGVVLMGDFAQLPPVLSSSLMFGMAIEVSKKSGLRPVALSGRQTFASFQDVIRFRMI